MRIKRLSQARCVGSSSSRRNLSTGTVNGLGWRDQLIPTPVTSLSPFLVPLMLRESKLAAEIFPHRALKTGKTSGISKENKPI